MGGMPTGRLEGATGGAGEPIGGEGLTLNDGRTEGRLY